MSIPIQWVVNRAKRKIYAVAHAKGTIRGNSTVDADLTKVENDLNGIHSSVDKLRSDFDSVNLDKTSSHITSSVVGATGVHGMRYYDDTLQYYSDGSWHEIFLGSSGAAPSAMRDVSVDLGATTNTLVLRGSDPLDTVADGVLVVKWAGTRIVRKAGSYPKNPNDGIIVADYSIRDTYATKGLHDTGLSSGVTYYYRWFPYSTQGAFNLDSAEHPVNRAAKTTTTAPILGVTVTFGVNGVNNIARSDAAVGRSAGAGFDEMPMFGGRRRCIVSEYGEILAYQGEEGYTETGVTKVDISTPARSYPAGTRVNVMVKQPMFYYRVSVSSTSGYNGGKYINSATIQLSEAKYAGFSIHPAFVVNGTEVPYILVSAFEASKRDNMIASVVGMNPMTGNSEQFRRSDAVAMAARIGTGWGITTLNTLSATQMLFLVEYATFNSQTAIGNGNVDGSDTSFSYMVKTGSTSSLGNSSGAVGSGVSYRGEENLWGNAWCWIDGAEVENNGSGHIKLNGTDTGIVIARLSGYFARYGYSSSYDNLFIPSSEVAGSSTSQFSGDTVTQQYTAAQDTDIAVGGGVSSRTGAGLFCYDMSLSPGTSGDVIGARLVYLPKELG